MKRAIIFMLTIAFTLGFYFMVPAKGQNVDDAMQLARKLTDEGAATFNTLNAKAMADYYTDTATIFLEIKDQSGHSIKEYTGREEIEKSYADLFKNPDTVQGKNTVEYAKLVAPDILVIAGTFVPNMKDPKPLKVPFYQVRVKHGEKWLMSSLRIFAVLQENP